MAKHHQRPTLFPAADAQLPKIHVTPEQHEELRAYMLPMAQEVIREGPTWGRSNVGSAQARGWKLVNSTLESAFLTKSSGKSYQSLTKAGDKKQSQRGATSMQTPPTAAQCFMGYSKVPMSLEAIMSSVYCETTEELRVHTENTYGSVCLDCCVLETLEGATLEDPFWYLGIKWIALKSPVKKLVSSREFAFLELSGTHVRESDGQRMLYRILQSVNLCSYGGKDAYFGLTRAHIEVAYVYWVDEAASTPERPVLNVCTKGRAHLKGNLPLWLVQLYLKKLWTLKRSRHPQEVLQSTVAGGGGSATEFLQMRKRSVESERSPRSTTTGGSNRGGSSDRGFGGSNENAPFDMATTWVPNEERSACCVCKKRFQLVRRPKHHCRSCGEVICSDCTSYAKLNVRTPISRKRSSRALLLATGRDNGHAVSRSASAGTATLDQPFSISNMGTSQHKARVKAPRNVMPGDSVGTYVTVGKVCHQCIDLKAIMHSNSAAYGHHYQQNHHNQSPPARGVTVWKYEGFDAKQQQYKKLLTLHPERDDAMTEPNSSNNNNNSGTYTYGTSSTNTNPNNNNNAAGGHVLSSSSDDEEKYGALEPGSWRAAGLIVGASKYRKGSVSSLTSSDVRAIIEENAERHETESAAFTEGGRSSIVTLEERECREVDDDDAEVDEDDSSSCHEDLEFKPATVASANELLASSEAAAVAQAIATAADQERSYSGSLSNFNPDMLFDLHGELSDDDDDAEGGSDADFEDFSSREEEKSSIRRAAALESSASSYEPLAMMALLSPTASSPPSTPLWSHSWTHTGNGVSIADVKLAIADHAALLDAVQCEHHGGDHHVGN